MQKDLQQSLSPPHKLQKVVLGGGCFWCLEVLFAELKGVQSVACGYAGGKSKNPSYRQVCEGTSGHAEVIEIRFNPDIISFQEILRIFFVMHNPTTPNQQGADKGTQYRSVIFYENPEQKNIAEKVIAELQANNDWGAPIVTEVTPLEAFYRAEDYHQEYYKKNPGQPYCSAVIAPKIKKFRLHYSGQLKE